MPQDSLRANSPQIAFEIFRGKPNELPTRVIVMPDERLVEARDGRVFKNDARDRILEAFASRDVEIGLDEGHGMDDWFRGSDRATGWVTALHEVGEFGLEAEVEWTPVGKQLLADKIYRYFSPTVALERGDEDEPMTVVGLIGGGLVNRPALRQRALASEQRSSGPEAQKAEKERMNPIATELGLKGSASEEAQLSAVKELKEENAALATAAQVAEDGKAEALAEVDKLKAEAFEARKAAVFEKFAASYLPAEKEHLEALAKDEAGLESVRASLAARQPLLSDSGLNNEDVSDSKEARRAATAAAMKKINPGLPDEAIERALDKQEKRGE